MDFLKYRYVAIVFSLLVIIGGITYGLLTGYKFDIDFKGGVVIETNIKEEFDNNEMQNLIKNITDESPLIQKTTGGENRVTITLEPISSEQETAVIEALKDKYKNMEEPSTRNIQPAYGRDLINSALLAIGVSVVLILIYICIRFKTLGVAAAISAIIALLHDTLFLIAVYGIFKFPINSVFVAVALTIIGYSINDTIVIYDRIRENKRKLNLAKDLKKTINTSLSECMTRTIYTSLTTVAVVIVMYILAALNGQQVLMQFSLPLVIGVLVGTYSSIFIATSLWYMFSNIKIGKANKD